MAADMENTSMKSYPMVGGEGPQSYAQNSSSQKKVVENTKELIHEAVIEKLDLQNLPDISYSNNTTFRIADLGCSVGPNTFIAVQNIIDAIQSKYHKTYNIIGNPEFQVFFNDHSDNDFNTLFRLLPPSRNYFTNSVPGSFHGRLFPNSSLHFVHSSTALHWLSKVPEEVVDSKSPAWNKGSIICTGLVKEVSEAYSNQFNNDMHTFLMARAPEIVHGGLMVLILLGLPDGVTMSQTATGMNFEILRSCLNDLANLGLVKQEEVDSFNIPFYFPSPKEMVGIIERNGYFSVEKIQELSKASTKLVTSMDIQLRVTSHIRAIAESLIKEHFGHEIVDELFSRFQNKFANSNHTFTKENTPDIDLFILLKRKAWID
ncbi:SAM dependent carboxyl methyltransferase [Corchorus capsularis]|uniref:SAM dependent carboxyl methyltransferase n=1 Tax=Corchorus capsularis TaxID=210143 RepID=A0A1R3KZA7_COCAP|nr:SAM dependent carboxyl methyltransferase [Corchorus capsularis]